MPDERKPKTEETDGQQKKLEEVIEKFIGQRLNLLRDNDAVSKRQLRSLFFMPMKISLIMCESSNVSAYGYNERSKTLAVVFKGGGEYRYLNVDKTAYDFLLKSPSKGKAITAIKIKHGFVQIPKDK